MQRCNAMPAVVAEQVFPLVELDASVPVDIAPPELSSEESWSPARVRAAEILASDPSVVRALYATAYRYSAPDPEGVVQDSIIGMSKLGDELDQEKMLGLARNSAKFVSLDQHRREQKQDRIAAKSENMLGPLRPESEHSVEAEVLAMVRRRVVGEAIGRLSAVYRPMIELVFFKGQSIAKAAEELDIPLGTARSRVRDGYRVMKNYLEGIGITEAF